MADIDEYYNGRLGWNLNPNLFVKDGQGNVAVVYYQNRSGYQVSLPNGHVYTFVTRAMDICMAWIPEADVQAVLDTPGGCNCPGMEKKPGAHRLANELQARRWDTNNATAWLPQAELPPVP